MEKDKNIKSKGRAASARRASPISCVLLIGDLVTSVVRLVGDLVTSVRRAVLVLPAFLLF